VGAALFSSGLASDATYAAAAGRHFGYVTAEWEMKWKTLQRTQGAYDFSGGDKIVAFAEARSMRVKGHALVWHGATPSWLDPLSPPELRIALEDHIRRWRGTTAATCTPGTW
jgi:endo-1,4-beta-xylanase